jgi:hypothetical protein
MVSETEYPHLYALIYILLHGEALLRETPLRVGAPYNENDFKRFENLLATKSFSEIVKYAQDADSTVPADMEELDEYLRWSRIAVV